MPNAAEECKESAQQGEGAVVEAAASIIAWYYFSSGADPFVDERADDKSDDLPCTARALPSGDASAALQSDDDAATALQSNDVDLPRPSLSVSPSRITPPSRASAVR